MFTVIGIGDASPSWGNRPGFPWVARRDAREGLEEYDHIIYNGAHALQFYVSYWYYTPEPRTPLLRPIARAWRKRIRESISWLCGYSPTAQRYRQPFWLLFLPQRNDIEGYIQAINDTNLGIITDGKMSTKHWIQSHGSASDMFTYFVDYLNYVTTLPIRRQKTSDFEVFETWLAARQ